MAPVLICGAAGTLGLALGRACRERGISVSSIEHRDLDVCDAAAVESVLDRVQPAAIANAAGYVRVDDAERERAACFRINVAGASVLGAAADARRIPFLTFSSDLVFGDQPVSLGDRAVPFVESDRVTPLNVYGESKAAAERAVLRWPRSLVVRTAAFFGAGARGDFLTNAMRAIGAGERVPAISDVRVSPTYLPDLAEASLQLLTSGATGLFHLTNAGIVTWAEFAQRGAVAGGFDPDMVEPRLLCAFKLAARRPSFSALKSERCFLMPTLEDALSRFIATFIQPPPYHAPRSL